MEKEKIGKMMPGLKSDIGLKNYTTFKIGGPAEYFFEAKNKEDLIGVVDAAKKCDLPIFVMGGGSNLLISEEGLKGLVIKMQNKGYKIENKEIYVEAGLGLGSLVNILTRAGLSGLEWAAGIPGTVGGAVFGNAGAFGGSMAEAIKEVEALDTKSGEIKIFKKEDCELGYRTSIFKKNPGLLIVSCKLALEEGDVPKIKERIKEILRYRQERHPKEPSAGSIFKNASLENIKPEFFENFPEAKNVIKENVLPAAYLIDQCGLKGKIIGGAMVSDKHPNFIVNYKSAGAKEVLELINFIKNKVKEKFGIELEEELRILGF